MLLSKGVLAKSLIRRSFVGRSAALFSSKDPSNTTTAVATPIDDDSINPNVIVEKNEVQLRTENMQQISSSMLEPKMAWGIGKPRSDPVLPEDASEVATLDMAQIDDGFISAHTGKGRKVRIRQIPKAPSQSPETTEKEWTISFQDDGASGNTWSNPLMGWVSSADPMSSNMGLQLSFSSAKDAVYFARKKGWVFEIERPRLRKIRSDGATYQDVFLPQSVASDTKERGKKCDQWHRTKAGASHYFRPPKYHGDGVVRQHGANCEEETLPPVESYYKLR